MQNETNLYKAQQINEKKARNASEKIKVCICTVEICHITGTERILFSHHSDFCVA